MSMERPHGVAGVTERHTPALAEAVRRTLPKLDWRIQHMDIAPDRVSIAGWALPPANKTRTTFTLAPREFDAELEDHALDHVMAKPGYYRGSYHTTEYIRWSTFAVNGPGIWRWLT